MAEELLKTGRHTVTAITRIDSNTPLPEGVEVKKVDYDNPPTLVEALQGQDALIITMNVFAPRDQQAKLIQAAADANVPWILPNDWSVDTSNEELVKDVIAFQGPLAARELITKAGKSSYISVATSFWYEWSLAMAPGFGFDLNNQAVTLFDEGEVKVSTSTWPQVGRAVARLLSLPIQPEGGDEERCLEQFRNKIVYVSSFTVSQKDMLDSVLRVTGTSIDDWKVTKEPVKERYANGIKVMQGGDRIGFAKMMYSRMFYPDGSGDFGEKTINALLGLHKEDLDEATRAAVKRAKEVKWP